LSSYNVGKSTPEGHELQEHSPRRGGRKKGGGSDRLKAEILASTARVKHRAGRLNHKGEGGRKRGEGYEKLPQSSNKGEGKHLIKAAQESSGLRKRSA